MSANASADFMAGAAAFDAGAPRLCPLQPEAGATLTGPGHRRYIARARQWYAGWDWANVSQG